jgi:hypothetical protein
VEARPLKKNDSSHGYQQEVSRIAMYSGIARAQYLTHRISEDRVELLGQRTKLPSFACADGTSLVNLQEVRLTFASVGNCIEHPIT